MIARDWLKTLFPASYKGVPFWVERDNERGSRRIVEHEFPMRDDPYLEDLGEGVRRFEVTAYVASDAADREAADVIAICAQRGPGILVLPTHGQVLVKCLEFGRDRGKDRHGYIALQLRFTREGFGSALATVFSLANLVYVHADGLAAAAAAAFVGSLSVADQPDYVADAAVSGIYSALATLETIRTAEPVDVEVSARQRDAIDVAYSLAPELITGTAVVDPAVAVAPVAIARALAFAMPATAAVRSFEAVLQNVSIAAPAGPFATAGSRTAALNAVAGQQLTALAAFVAYCEAIVRLTIADRPAGITIRANLAEYSEAILMNLSAEDAALYLAMVQIRDATIAYLSRVITDLAPVITVSANLSMPSLYWAWRLYKAPERGTELAARNRVAHPSFIPPEFEALGPT